MKMNFKSVSAMCVVSLLSLAQSSFAQTSQPSSDTSSASSPTTTLADGTQLTQIPSGASGSVISCGLDHYNNKIATIKRFNRAEDIVAITVPSTATSVLIILAETGLGEGPVAEVAAGVVAVGVGTYYAITGVKDFEARHYTEVQKNFNEAASYNPGENKKFDKHLRHTLELINKEIHSNYTEIDLVQALMNSASSGDLCNAAGNLEITEDFRSILEKHLQSKN